MSTDDMMQGFSRRFAQISLPGVTEPMVTDCNINTVVTKHQDERTQQKLRSRAKAREQMLTLSEISFVEFNLYSTEEIDTYAVVNITSTDKEGPGTVRDLKMGPHSENNPCDTCSNDIRNCPGHIGKIIIPKLMHPLAINTIILVLSCVCNTCGHLLVTRQEIERNGITRMSGIKRLQAIKELVGKLKRSCNIYANIPDVQHCDPNPIYSSIRENKDDYRLAYTYPGAQNHKKTPFFLPPDIPDNIPGKSIYKILHSIPDEDAQLLGFVESHPQNMIMDRLVVVPYCARPDLFQGDAYYPDDLTTMYIDIVKSSLAYNNHNNSEADQDTHLKSIYFKVSHLMKNDGRYSQGGVKVYTDVKKRVQGKTAIVRANIMGKRVNFAGRTVIGPGPDLRVDQVGIPYLMALRLTRPIKVSKHNIAELQGKYNDGRVKHITLKEGSLAGARVSVNESFEQKYPNYILQIGDIVERILEDGDVVLINRQPTLHKQNILAAYTKIINDRIVRINLSVTTPLNADFDGDEINIHVPQTIEAYAEAEQLLGIHANLMSAQTNKPMMGIVYDTLSGAYLLTYPQEEIERLDREISKLEQRSLKIPDEINVANQDLTKLYPETEDYSLVVNQIEKLTKEQSNIPVKIKQYKERQIVLRDRVELDPVVFDLAIKNVENTPQYKSLYNRLEKYKINQRSGRALISSVFPEDFDYNANDIVIKNGIVIKGMLSKDSLGTKDGSIIAEMVKQNGGHITVDFMSNIQFVVKDFLMQHGLSVGIDDCCPDNIEFRNSIDDIVTKATQKVIDLSGKPINRVAAEQQERKICEVLDIAKNEGDSIVKEYFDPDNGILIMAHSGAKGTPFNVIQMSSLLGSQKVSGKRILANLPGNRSLPCIEPGSKDPRDRGFCSNSFSSGLNVKEFFFHSQGGREGLTDTAVNTAQTGFLQHQIIKSAEDVHICPDGSVRSADWAIVQFVYGEDGLDSEGLSTVKIRGEKVPFFRDLNQLADKINRKYNI
jgi:DNA-directed RNA polymerase beta' subunit